jgi:hypothetical protein
MREAVGHFGEGGELGRDFGAEEIGRETPAPVATFEAWDVHASLATEVEHILQRNDAEIGD